MQKGKSAIWEGPDTGWGATILLPSRLPFPLDLPKLFTPVFLPLDYRLIPHSLCVVYPSFTAEFATGSLVAEAAGGPGVGEGVLAPLCMWDYVVYFGTVWL